MALRSYLDGALFAETYGDGPPEVLALHGWARRGNDFARTLEDIPSIAPDLPGFGASPEPESVIGAHGYAEVIAPLLEEFSVPPVIVAHSFGGRVAVCLASRWPELAGPLVLTGVPLLRGEAAKPALTYRIARSLNKIGLISDDRMEAERRRRGSADYRAARGVMRDILVKVVNESYPDELRAIQSPVTMIWGEDDRDAPLSQARRAMALMQEADVDVTLETLTGVGHMVPLEAADRLRSSVESVRH